MKLFAYPAAISRSLPCGWQYPTVQPGWHAHEYLSLWSLFHLAMRLIRSAPIAARPEESFRENF